MAGYCEIAPPFNRLLLMTSTDEQKQEFSLVVSGEGPSGETQTFFEGTVRSLDERGAREVGRQVCGALERQLAREARFIPDLEVEISARKQARSGRSR